MKAIFDKLFSNIIGTVVGLYFMAAFLVFTPYYNWNYAQTHGFVKWAFFGEVVATAKAIAWPYSVFFSPSGGSVSHVSKAIDYANKAMATINKGGHINKFRRRILTQLSTTIKRLCRKQSRQT